MGGELCIVVHGFTGSPAEILPLTQALSAAGYEVLAPVLPGHDGTREALGRATASAWTHEVEALVNKHGIGRPVHMIGFSMGAMIAAVVASRRPVASLTMLAPAVYYARPRQVFRQMATYIKANWDKAGNDALYMQRRGDQFLMAPLYSLQQFRRLVQMAKAALPQVCVPLCIIQGRLDEIVEPQSADYVLNTVSSAHKEIHYLEHSRHMICLDNEAEVAIATILRFLQNPVIGLRGPTLDHTVHRERDWPGGDTVR